MASKSQKPVTSLISDSRLRELYSRMLECRLLEDHLSTTRRRHGHARSASRPGNEAIFVAGAINLRRGDWISAPSGVDGPGYVAGASEPAILSELFDPASNVATSANFTLPAAPSVTAQANLAAGVAVSLQRQKKGNVVTAFLGRSGGRVERWSETIEYAGAQTLPVLFFTERTLDARRDTRTTAKKPVLQRSHEASVPLIPVDAHDVVALYRVAYESLHKARHGGGPTVIEAVVLPATTTTKELAHQGDPLLKMEQYLRAKGLYSVEWKQRTAKKFLSRLENASPPKAI